MPRRKRTSRKPEIQRYTLRVDATSVRISRLGPKINFQKMDGEASSSITIEGHLDRPAYKDLTHTNLLVIERDEDTCNPGSAIGGTIIWNAVVSLPRVQFADLLAIVLANKLVAVDLGFEGIRRGSGTIRSVSFETAPVPNDIEDENESG
jgi:hypothetical protein